METGIATHCITTMIATVFVIEFTAVIHSANGCLVATNKLVPRTRKISVAFLNPGLIRESPGISTATDARPIIQAGTSGETISRRWKRASERAPILKTVFSV